MTIELNVSDIERQIKQIIANHVIRFDEDDILRAMNELYEEKRRPISHIEITDRLVENRAKDLFDKKPEIAGTFKREGFDRYVFDSDWKRIVSNVNEVLRRLYKNGHITWVPHSDERLKEHIGPLLDEAKRRGYVSKRGVNFWLPEKRKVRW